jgi:Trypsin-like peptidase domain
MPPNLDEFSADDLLLELRAREEDARDEDEPELPSDEAEDEAEEDFLNPALADVETETLASVLYERQKVIYGTDDRKDIFEITNDALLKDSDCVVALFEKDSVRDNGDATSTLQTEQFGTANDLCSSEPFRRQPVGAFCSGFLVAPDVVVTAGHCVDPPNTPVLTDIRFVFGFRMVSATQPPGPIPNSEIYSGRRLLGRQLTQAGLDWAVVRLDRRVTGHRPAPVRRRRRIGRGARVHVIGHPVGLPAKLAGNAIVRDNTPNPFFVANLDTYGGNSGSPVFNSRTHRVEGILVRGERDFMTRGNCTVSFVCPTTGCRGEDVTRITKLVNLIPPP